MAQRLLKFFEDAEKKGGFALTVKLAMVTKISSVKAKDLPDSPENIKLFEDAFKQL
jgi:hypothetical protein